MFFSFGKKKTPEKLWFTTDIHCHLVPGIDDGSENPEESVELIGRMKEWGLHRLLFTPHVTRDTFENNPETVGAAYATLKDALEKSGINIDTGTSAEYRMDDLFMEHIEKGILMPYPNDYLLVENPFVQEAPMLDQLIFDLQLKGYRPIMAHPERFSYYWKHPGRLEKLHAAGALFQVNLLSLAGAYGKEQRKMALQLTEAGLVDFLGSDLHHANHADAIESYLCSRDYERDRKALTRYIRNDRAFI